MQQYQVDAFTKTPFNGNPAAVCILEDHFPSETYMQSLALENNLSETAFVLPKENEFEIRWFTPTTEVNLCGHATLASAHVLFNELHSPLHTLVFHSKGGRLVVKKYNDRLDMFFPVMTIKDINDRLLLQKIKTVLAVQKIVTIKKGGTDLIVELDNEETVANLKPNLSLLKQLNEYRGIIVTSKGNKYDFVSRFFAPQSGINEDPVTGSAHTALVPYWSDKLSKKHLSAAQLSQRFGEIDCELLSEKEVRLSGYAVTTIKSEVMV